MIKQTLNETDHKNAWRLHAQPNKRKKIGNLCVLTFYATIVTAYIWHSQPDISWPNLALIFAAIFVALGLLIWLLILILQEAILFLIIREYRDLKSYNRAITLSWDDTKLHTATERGDIYSLWSEIRNRRENEKFILLYYSASTFLIILKSAFPNQEMLQQFQQLISHIPQK